MEKSREEKLLDAIFSEKNVCEAHFREFREHALAIAKDFVVPVDTYKFTGLDADKGKLVIYYFDMLSRMPGSVTICEKDGGWEYEDATELPEGASIYVLISWLLMQYAHIQAPGIEW